MQLALSTSRLEAWLSRRGQGFWIGLLVAVGALIYLPYLASYPLWDPWEPHYLQVAWEMQERLTWMNPWYRGEDNWWSKPILLLWLLRASIGVLWDSAQDFANHALAARLPFALIAIAGGVLHYDWVRRLYGRPTGVLAGLVLITAPQYLMIGRQVMIDVTFVLTYAASLGYLAVGLFTPRPPLAPASAPRLVRARAWLAREWPFVAFWSLEAVSLLAKGFVSQVLVVIVLTGYVLGTFRWQDYADLVRGRAWLRYALQRGALALVVLGLAAAAAHFIPRSLGREQRLLYQALVLGPAGLAVLLGVFHDFPLSRHALHMLRRVRAGWGLALFFALGAPWYVYMTLKHGWPYWNEFIFYHHLGRAAGTIEKPGNTFDYFVRQIAFGVFPWSAFLVGAFWQFMQRSSPVRSVAERRNFFFFIAAALPFLFFCLSGTKFAHYVFPVLPFVVVLIAVAIVWLGGEAEERVPLAEEGPPLGPAVPGWASRPADEPARWWEKSGAKGDFTVLVTTALITFGVLCYDLVGDFRYIPRLFLYYASRATPDDYKPYIVLQLFFTPIGVALGLLLLERWVTRRHLAAFAAGAVALACYFAWVTLPAMKDTYTYRPFLAAYEKHAKPGEPIGQYNDWQQPERSVIFLFQNRAAHLSSDKKAEAFLQRPGRKFIIVDGNRLAALRRVAAKLDKKLYVVAKDHPYAMMVSDVPNPEDAAAAKAAVIAQVPPDMQRVDADFEGKIRWLGWSAPTTTLKRGESVEVTYYFQAQQLMDDDWQLFVHGDGSRGNSRRVHLDHYPVGGLYPTNEWQQGEIVKDTFTVKIPQSYPYEYVVLWTGFYNASRRMELSNNAANDGDNRVRGPRLSVVGE